MMQIQWNVIPTDFRGDYCFTHARGVVTPTGFGVMTAQPLRLSGSDIFYGMYLSTTTDGGKTWSALTPSEHVVRRDLGGGFQIAMSDATPIYHKKTGKILLLGQSVLYLDDELAPNPRPRHTLYSIYDEESGDFSPFRQIDMPQDEAETYFSSKAAACDPWHGCESSAVVRCAIAVNIFLFFSSVIDNQGVFRYNKSNLKRNQR